MATTDRFATAFLRGDPRGMYQFAQEVGRLLDTISQRTGGAELKKADVASNNPQIVSPPPSAQFSVQGQGTNYLVRISNPQNVSAMSASQGTAQIGAPVNPSGTPIYHNLQSASDLTFTANSSLTDHGISPQTSFLFPATGKNTCWRFRSSYDGKTWNGWQTLTASGASAAVSTASGTSESTASGSTYIVLPFSATPTFDASKGNGGDVSFEMTLTGNVTSSNCLNVSTGQVVTFVLLQDSVGGHTFAWPGNVNGGVTINPSANSVTVQSFEGRSDGALYAFSGAPVSTLTLGFIINSGVTGVNVGPMLAAPRAGTISKCVVAVKASDGATALTFTIKQNGTAIFTANPTVAAGTAAGTVLTFTALTGSPLSVAAGDVFSIDITSGADAWKFSAQLES